MSIQQHHRHAKLLGQLRRESEACATRRIRLCDDNTPALAVLVRLAYKWPRATALHYQGLRFQVREDWVRVICCPEGLPLVCVSGGWLA